MIKDKLFDLINKFPMAVTNDKKRHKLQSEFVYAAFFVISLVMSVINIITSRIPLLIATSSFAVLCAVNFILAQYTEKTRNVARYLFMGEITILFTYFIITGGTDNFSIVWLLLLPPLGLFFFGRKKGSIVCAVVFVIMLCCFYLPFLQDYVTDYGKTFETRFPVVFVCAYIVSWLLEEIRSVTARELEKMRLKYIRLYNHDALTGLYNRYGLHEQIARLKRDQRENISVAMFDIDHFKQINDNYGHNNGDNVLTALADIAKEVSPKDSIIARWGGEEFVIVYLDDTNAKDEATNLLEAVRNHNFVLDGKPVKVTISIGIVNVEKVGGPTFDEVILRADTCLYNAKNSGRDCMKTE